jgi:uncharacterized protein YcbX
MTGRVIGTVSELARYPVKSMAGELLQTAAISNAGLEGDRVWALRDLSTGELTSAKTVPKLLRLSAALPGTAHADGAAHVRVTFPDGSTMSSADDAIHQRLSDQLERSMRLEPLQPASNRKHYRLARLRSPKKLRQFLGVTRNGGLPDLSVLPWSMLYTLSFFATPPGTYFDAYPIHLVTTRSLQSLSRQVTASDVKIARFRPNLVIDTASLDGDGEYPELGWSGGTLTIGNVVLRIIAPTFRCSMPGHAQVGFGKSPAVVKTVYRELDSKFGAYATVVSAGTVEVGATVAFEPAPRRGVMRRGAARFGHSIKRFALRTFLAIGRGGRD